MKGKLKMRKFNVKIKANEAFPYYMQHRMDDQKLAEWEKQRGMIIERDDVAKEDQVRAEYHSYRNDDSKQFFIPSAHIKGAMIYGGKFVKSKVGSSTRSMGNIVAAMFYVISPNGGPREELPLTPQEYQIDKRSAVNKNVKARVITVRPKWQDWKTSFTLLIDNDTITEETIRSILEYTGRYVGIGSFRPTNSGEFGRFEIEQFEKIE